MDHRPPPSPAPSGPARAARAALAAGLLALSLTACSDTDAYPHAGQSDGWAAGSSARTLLLYLVVPVLIGVALMALAYLPGALRRNRYRPQEGWTAAPVWFAGPSDPVAAVEQAQTGDVVRGGAGGSW